MSQKKKFITYVIMATAAALGTGSLILFTLFLYLGSLDLIQMDMAERQILIWDGILSLLFFIQHSGMIRKSVRNKITGVIPAPYFGALFSITSGSMLILVVLLWQDSAHIHFQAGDFLRILLRCVFFAAIAGFFWGAHALENFDSLGLHSIRAKDEESRPLPASFTVQGPFRRVRHPLYFFTLLMIWSCPEVSSDRILFNLAWSAWIVTGAMLEERDLAATFGSAYRDYQGRVPMLIPWKRRFKERPLPTRSGRKKSGPGRLS